jgi:hypothetical protein
MRLEQNCRVSGKGENIFFLLKNFQAVSGAQTVVRDTHMSLELVVP